MQNGEEVIAWGTEDRARDIEEASRAEFIGGGTMKQDMNMLGQQQN